MLRNLSGTTAAAAAFSLWRPANVLVRKPYLPPEHLQVREHSTSYTWPLVMHPASAVVCDEGDFPASATNSAGGHHHHLAAHLAAHHAMNCSLRHAMGRAQRSMWNDTQLQHTRSLHRMIQSTNNDDLRVAELINWFCDRGHLVAPLDPLGRRERGLWENEVYPEKVSTSSPNTIEGLLEWLIQRYPWEKDAITKGEWLCGMLGVRASKAHEQLHVPNLQSKKAKQPTFKFSELFEHLVASYAGTLSCQFTHLNLDQQLWVMDKLENRKAITGADQRAMLHSLQKTHKFETFLTETFPSSKKFGIEGCEAFIPGLEAAIRKFGELGATDIYMGMSHRGRLSLLHTIMQKPMGAICCEMLQQQSDFHIGDVIYHQGLETKFIYDRLSTQRLTEEQAQEKAVSETATVNLHLFPNPSHLEVVDPVIMGITRAKQHMMSDSNRRSIVPLIIHGDAAFSGLGIVHETLQLSLLDGYRVGGTVHLVINNQMGYTTTPNQARSSVYATDIAKVALAPIFRANGDDVEAVSRACELAAEFRDTFHHDAVVDIMGYRRRGHNELDDPTITLPNTYEKIRNQPPVLEIYQQKCIDAGVVGEEDIARWDDALARTYKGEHSSAMDGDFQQDPIEYLADAVVSTGIVQSDIGFVDPTGLPLHRLKTVGERLCRLSDVSLNVHPAIEQLMKRRSRMVRKPKSRVDWAMSEMLALSTLAVHRSQRPVDLQQSSPLLDARTDTYAIRLSGQDSERGTFNQRHAALYDQDSGHRYVPLAHFMPGGQSDVEVWNSPLNEAAVLGFEYGASLGYGTNGVVIWEAQFGDFANNAQSVIDQFIAAGEDRWGQRSNLVLLLPHGYDGQGPDHSSARIERFLQMMNDDSDALPGRDPNSRRLINWTIEALGDCDSDDMISKEKVFELLSACVVNPSETLETLWLEMCLHPEQDAVPRFTWERFMTSFLRRNAERTANMFILNCTTPAQYFHALRRQAKRPYQKPLIIITPKYLLHHKPCSSALEDFGPGTFFTRVITEGKANDNMRHIDYMKGVEDEEIKRVVICSGQVFYKLYHMRTGLKVKNVKFIRLEQIAPFPHDRIVDAIANYPDAEVVWCQEEPKNMGAWFYVKPRLEAALKEFAANNGHEYQEPRYVGRAVSASTATASFSIHRDEEEAYLHRAIDTSALEENRHI